MYYNSTVLPFFFEARPRKHLSRSCQAKLTLKKINATLPLSIQLNRSLVSRWKLRWVTMVVVGCARLNFKRSVSSGLAYVKAGEAVIESTVPLLV